MTLQMFAVFDSKISMYAKPFTQRSNGEALRSWMDIVQDEQSSINKHPEDFTLFHLGQYHEDTGTFTNLEVPLSLGPATEYIKKTN